MNCPRCGSDKTKKKGFAIYANGDKRQRYYCRSCNRKFTEDSENESSGNTVFEDNGNSIHVVCASPRILTKDELLQQFNVDSAVWEVEKFKVKTSEGYRKDRQVTWRVEGGMVTSGNVNDTGKMLVVPLYHIEATLRRKTEEVRASLAINDMKKDAAAFAPIYPVISYGKRGGRLYEIAMPDIHFGRLAWDEESGENYDIKIAEETALRVLSNLLARVGKDEIEKILLPVGNDFFNVNTQENTTVHGTPQREDTRWQKTFRAGRILAIKMIDLCSSIAPVDVMIVYGNHDEERTFYMGDSLECWYSKHKNVTVDNSAPKRKYYLHGKNMIGFTHGYYEKYEKLPFIMATEKPTMWAETINREWHLGDKHHKKDMVYTLDEGGGMVIRILRSIAAADAWTADKGYVGAKRGAEGLLWDKFDGIISQFTETV